MKIEIEWNSSTDATLRIDGREMKIELRGRMTSLKGAGSDNTIGYLFADSLFGKVADFMQAEASATEFNPDLKTWDVITDDAILGEIEDCLL